MTTMMALNPVRQTKLQRLELLHMQSCAKQRQYQKNSSDVMIIICYQDDHHLQLANCQFRSFLQKLQIVVLDHFWQKCKLSFRIIFCKIHSLPFLSLFGKTCKLLFQVIFFANMQIFIPDPFPSAQFGNCKSGSFFPTFANCSSRSIFAYCYL